MSTARDPFKIQGRTSVSFSGGSTSGYMGHRVLQSNSREVIEQSVKFCFANTGKEDEATLEFVRDCGKHWDIPITWVEYRDNAQGFEVVDFETASRNGEPFEAILKKRNYLPNAVTRFCTVELKIRAMHKYLRSLGWHEGDDGWDTMIGIRADEQRRVSKIRARGTSTESSKESMCLLLADAGIKVQDVDAFWENQPFKLNLPRYRGRTLAGNCDLCFLKPPAQRLSLIAEKPERAIWWARMEKEAVVSTKPRMVETGFFDEAGEPLLKEVIGDGWRFAKDGPTYAQMLDYAQRQGDAFAPPKVAVYSEVLGADGAPILKGLDDEAPACFCGD